MNLPRFWGRQERRSALSSWDLLRWGGYGGGELPGLPVNADVVLSASSVAARCVALRSELLASVPLFVHRRTDEGGRERADDLELSESCTTTSTTR